MINLNLGCGTDIKQGFVNLDLTLGPGVDVVADIEEHIPFEDSSVRFIFASHVFEHCFDWEAALVECHRVLMHGGRIDIRVPYGLTTTAYHRRFFRGDSMDGFLLKHKDTPNTSHQRFHKFKLISRLVWHQYPFAWHVYDRLKVNLPIGRRTEIRWILEKPEGDKDA